jgi:hypothetical protein
MSAPFAGAKLFLVFIAGACLCVGACASRQQPAAATPTSTAPPPAQPKRLTWLPVDALDAPDVAKTINEHLGRLKIAGTGESVKAAVSLEVAQLAIECTDPTPACYRAVGRSLGADQILWAELRRNATPKRSIRIALALFDVRAGTPPKLVEKTFEGAEAARAGVGDLVNGAFASAVRTP